MDTLSPPMSFGGYPYSSDQMTVAQLHSLSVHPEVVDMPKIGASERDLVRQSMRDTGYHSNQPLVLDAATRTLVDGATRRSLAVELAFASVPVVLVEFPDEGAIFRYNVAANLARRHLTKEQRETWANKLIERPDHTVDDVAAALDISRTTAYEITKKGRAKKTMVKQTQMAAALDAGGSTRGVGVATGVNHSTVVRFSEKRKNAPPKPAKPGKLTRLDSNKVGRRMVELFGDGVWRTSEEIAAPLAVDTGLAQVNAALIQAYFANMTKPKGSFGGNGQRKKVGTEYKYRIFSRDVLIPLAEIRTELAPLIKGLVAEGRKHEARLSPLTVTRYANQMDQLLKRWVERGAQKTNGGQGSEEEDG